MKTKIITLSTLIFLTLAASVKGQIDPIYCYTGLPGGPPTPVSGTDPIDPWSLNCDFLHFSPLPTDPVKVVRVNFNIIQKDDGTLNFTPADALPGGFLDQVKTYLETNAFIINQPPTHPLPGVSDLASCKIKIKVMGIHFQKRSAGWDYITSFATPYYTPANLGINEKEEINIFFQEEVIDTPKFGGVMVHCNGYANASPSYSISAAPQYANPTTGACFVALKNTWQCSVAWGLGHRGVSRTIAHELGHALGLGHTHPMAGGGDDFSDTPVDVLNVGIAPCTGTSSDPPHTPPCLDLICPRSNNVMNYHVALGCHPAYQDVIQSYCSPMQIAYMHANLTKNPICHQYLEYESCTYDPTSPLIIDGANVIWEKNLQLDRDIIIEPDAKLTIRGCALVSMPGNGRIIVKPNGRLVVDNATLTSLCPGAMWDGIQVWGNPGLPQNYAYPWNQGIVELKNGAVIEHARCGITTSAKDAAGVTDWAHTGGGIIYATEAYFRNNRRDVEMMAYHNYPLSGKEAANRSFFWKCRFVNENYLRDHSYVTSTQRLGASTHVSLWEVKGIRFTECSFENRAPRLMPGIGVYPGLESVRGTGIFSIDAQFRVINSTATTDKFHWHNLSKGIESYGSGLLSSQSVEGVDFINLQQGMLLQGGAGHRVRFNYLETEDYPVVDPTAVFLEDMVLMGNAGFTVYDNVGKGLLGTSPVSAPYRYGIVSRSQGTSSGMIYKNQLFRKVVNAQFELENRNIDLQCNELDYSTAGVYVVAGGAALLPLQWSCGFGGTGMGNKYSASCSGAYWYNVNNSITTPLGYRENSSFVTSNGPNMACSPNVDITDCTPLGLGAVSINPCDKVFRTSPVLQAEMLSLQTEKEAQQLLLDEGDAESLLLPVRNDSSEQVVVSKLLGKSPYLSDRVLLECISRKPTPLSSSGLLSVLLPNSPLSPQILSEVGQRIPAMNASDLDALHAAQTGQFSPRRQAENLVERNTHAWQQDLAELTAHWMEDSTNAGMDSLLLLLGQETSEMAIKMMVPELALRKHFADGEALLSRLDPNTFADYLFLEQLRITLGREQRNWFQLTTQEQAKLAQLATQDSPEGWQARGILTLTQGQNHLFEPIPFPGSQPGHKRAPQPEVSARPASLQLYPNPASDLLTLQLASGELWQVEDRIEVLTATGQRMELISPQGETFELTLAHYPSGVYIVRWMRGQSAMETRRFVVLHE